MAGRGRLRGAQGRAHKEAAIEAIKYITSKELVASDFLMGSFSPVRVSVLSSDKYLDQGEAPSAKGAGAGDPGPHERQHRCIPPATATTSAT